MGTGETWTQSLCSRTTTRPSRSCSSASRRPATRRYAEKRQIVDRIIEELSKHAAIEEQIFYPVTRATVPDTEDIVLESLEEHHIVKWVLSELERHGPRRRALRRQGDGAHRERAPPRRGGGRRVLPQGPRRARPQRPQRAGRRDGRGQEDVRRPTRTPARPTPLPATSSPAPPPASSTGSATPSAASRRAACSAVQDLIARIRDRSTRLPLPPGPPPPGSRPEVCVERARPPSTARPDREDRAHRSPFHCEGGQERRQGHGDDRRSSAKKTVSTAKRATTTTKKTAAASAKRTSSAARAHCEPHTYRSAFRLTDPIPRGETRALRRRGGSPRAGSP